MTTDVSIKIDLEEEKDLHLLNAIISLKKVINAKPESWERTEKYRYKIIFKNGDIIGSNSIEGVYELLDDITNCSTRLELYAIFYYYDNITGDVLTHYLSK